MRAETRIRIKISARNETFFFMWSDLLVLVPWYQQFGILFRRSFQEQIRQYEIILIQLVQAIVIAVLIGTVFLDVRAEKQINRFILVACFR